MLPPLLHPRVVGSDVNYDPRLGVAIEGHAGCCPEHLLAPGGQVRVLSENGTLILRRVKTWPGGAGARRRSARCESSCQRVWTGEARDCQVTEFSRLRSVASPPSPAGFACLGVLSLDPAPQAGWRHARGQPALSRACPQIWIQASNLAQAMGNRRLLKTTHSRASPQATRPPLRICPGSLSRLLPRPLHHSCRPEATAGLGRRDTRSQ